MKIISTFMLLLSFNAFAGYQCELALSEAKDNKVLVTETIQASAKDIRSETIDDIFQRINRKDFALKVFIDGWNGEEEMNAVVINKNRSNPVTEKVSLMGDDKSTLWFDSYKLKVTCSLV